MMPKVEGGEHSAVIPRDRKTRSGGEQAVGAELEEIAMTSGTGDPPDRRTQAAVPMPNVRMSERPTASSGKAYIHTRID